MFVYFYNFGIFFYYLFLKFASLFNLKAAKLLKGQKNTFLLLPNTKKENLCWFHCASVGEFEQGFPLMQQLKLQDPSLHFLVTFFSPSGFEFVQKKYPAEWILYLPKDTSANMKKLIEAVQPKLVFIVKYEFWYHFIHTLSAKKIPVFLVSGIFRENQFFFKPIIGKLFTPILKNFNHFFLQNEESKQLLHSLGINNSTITGDTRFDRVIENKNSLFENQSIASFVDNKKTFIAGSCWNEDIHILKKIIALLPLDWKIILVPHEIDKFNTNWIQEEIIVYSEFQKNSNSRILYVNQMGLLSKMYRYATFAYIGGGFGKSIHNVLEAVVYGIPVIFGPNYKKFNEAVELVELNCAFSVKNEGETEQIVKNFVQNEVQLNEINVILNTYISENANVSDKIVVYLKENNYLNLK